jgi:hypothetical protein
VVTTQADCYQFSGGFCQIKYNSDFYPAIVFSHSQVFPVKPVHNTFSLDAIWHEDILLFGVLNGVASLNGSVVLIRE